MNNLIEAIKQKQKQAELSDMALTKLLGIDRSTWSYIRSGRRNPGMKFLVAVASKFPDLKTLVDVEIYDKGIPTTPHQKPQDKRHGIFKQLCDVPHQGFLKLFSKFISTAGRNFKK